MVKRKVTIIIEDREATATEGNIGVEFHFDPPLPSPGSPEEAAEESSAASPAMQITNAFASFVKAISAGGALSENEENINTESEEEACCQSGNCCQNKGKEAESTPAETE